MYFFKSPILLLSIILVSSSCSSWQHQDFSKRNDYNIEGLEESTKMSQNQETNSASAEFIAETSNILFEKDSASLKTLKKSKALQLFRPAMEFTYNITLNHPDSLAISSSDSKQPIVSEFKNRFNHLSEKQSINERPLHWLLAYILREILFLFILALAIIGLVLIGDSLTDQFLGKNGTLLIGIGCVLLAAFLFILLIRH